MYNIVPKVNFDANTFDDSVGRDGRINLGPEARDRHIRSTLLSRQAVAFLDIKGQFVSVFDGAKSSQTRLAYGLLVECGPGT